MQTPFPEPTCVDEFFFTKASERQVLLNILGRKQPFPANGICGILLWGTYGTGKTTLARLLPNLLDQGLDPIVAPCANPAQLHANDSTHYLLINCGGTNGPEVHKQIKEHTKLNPCFNAARLHYVVLDEVDELTVQAQSSLKASMNGSQVVFIMTTNHLPKLNAGLRNRVLTLEMNQPPAVALRALGARVVSHMGANPTQITPVKYDQIAQASNGSLRSYRQALTEVAIMLRQ